MFFYVFYLFETNSCFSFSNAWTLKTNIYIQIEIEIYSLWQKSLNWTKISYFFFFDLFRRIIDGNTKKTYQMD